MKKETKTLEEKISLDVSVESMKAIEIYTIKRAAAVFDTANKSRRWNCTKYRVATQFSSTVLLQFPEVWTYIKSRSGDIPPCTAG